MGRLTDDMARLRGEIDNLRVARGALMRQLTRGAGDLAQAVSAMTADFAKARSDMARSGRNDRETFLSGMRQQVAGLRQETADDLMGARLACDGHGLAMKGKEKDRMGEKPVQAGIKAKRGRK